MTHPHFSRSLSRFPSVFPAVLLTFLLMPRSEAEPAVHQVLTSAHRNLHVDQWSSPGGRGWSVQKTTLHGGKQEGVDIITVDNGKLTVAISPTRGMGILRAQMGRVKLGWDSPVKEVVHPSLINLQSRGGLGWLEGFNELVVRCGLEFAGHPGKDKFINNTGDEAEMDLTLHGKIANIPASEVEVVVETNGLIRIRGRVDERMFYGPKLVLWTELTTIPNSDSFSIHDRITNEGAHEQEFEMIYHSNYGPTLLEEGARFVAPLERVVPFNETAAKGLAHWTEYAAPTKGFVEQVYCLSPFAGSDHQTTVMLHNRAADQAVSMSWSVQELPYLTLWKNTAATEEGYVTGLEPGTSFPSNRRFERKAGRVPKLKPGETREFTIKYKVHDNHESVEETRERIVKILGNRTTHVETTPLPRQE